MNPIEIGGKRCCLCGGAKAPACVLCGMGGHSPEEISQVENWVGQFCAEGSFLLLFYESDDWNRDFSPWPVPAGSGMEAFPGGGEDTLRWLQGSALPYLAAEGWIGEHTGRYLAGYSLSGLFALWAFLKSGLFDGAACCSGSVWFPGWMDYVRSAGANSRGDVYLSLGSKEERSRNALMASVGDNMRQTYRLLKLSPTIRHITLEWNKGGHFANPEKRLATGIAKLIVWQENNLHTSAAETP